MLREFIRRFLPFCIIIGHVSYCLCYKIIGVKSLVLLSKKNQGKVDSVHEVDKCVIILVQISSCGLHYKYKYFCILGVLIFDSNEPELRWVHIFEIYPITWSKETSYVFLTPWTLLFVIANLPPWEFSDSSHAIQIISYNNRLCCRSKNNENPKYSIYIIGHNGESSERESKKRWDKKITGSSSKFIISKR